MKENKEKTTQKRRPSIRSLAAAWVTKRYNLKLLKDVYKTGYEAYVLASALEPDMRPDCRASILRQRAAVDWSPGQSNIPPEIEEAYYAGYDEAERAMGVICETE